MRQQIVPLRLVRFLFASLQDAHEKVAEFEVGRVAFVVGGQGQPFKEEVDGGEAVVEVVVEFGDCKASESERLFGQIRCSFGPILFGPAPRARSRFASFCARFASLHSTYLSNPSAP